MKTHLDMSGIVELEKKLAALESKQVDWGYVNGGVHSKAGIPYASLATMIEFGLGPGMPPRPAFRDHVERLKSNYLRFESSVKPFLSQYLEDKQSVHRVLDVAGTHLANRYSESMEYFIINGSENRNNKDSTVAIKGFDQPFVETGELISHVDYRIH